MVGYVFGFDRNTFINVDAQQHLVRVRLLGALVNG